jgi:cytochrome c oxidase assembly protein subunit 15
MAGLKAALVAPTWPSINGMWIPDGMAGKSFVSDSSQYSFYTQRPCLLLLVLLIGWFTMAVKSAGKNPLSILKKTSWWPMLSIVVQVLLGITVLMTAHYIVPGKFGTFEIFAELHQLVAMFLLMSLIINLYVAGKKILMHKEAA